MEQMRWTSNDKYECIKRELKMRKLVYARRVHDKKMSQAAADREIAIMEQIADDYKKQVELDNPRLLAD